MRQQLIPHSDIIDDLLAENWELRWRVFETFYRTQLILRDFSRSSREYRQARDLCREMAGRLNGASDVNLHLILTAAWLLGRNHFLLLVLEKLGVDDPETDSPETARQKKTLTTNQPEATFFDYFHSLLKRGKAVDVATRVAVRIFPAEEAFRLITAIPATEPRQAGIRLFRKYHPDKFFNQLLLADNLARLRQMPELLDFITLPLAPEESSEIENLVGELLVSSGNDLDFALRAVERLQLENCRKALKTLGDHPSVLKTRARLGEKEICLRLLQEARSWRRKKRIAALARLDGCQSLPEVRKLLGERFRRGRGEEREQALRVLAAAPGPETLGIILARLNESSDNRERKQLLQALAASDWPACSDLDPAGQLASLAEDIELYPFLTQALARFDFSEQWLAIMRRISSPVLKPHHQEIALYMCRFACRDDIRRHLLNLVNDIDWSFSFRLLNLLAPFLRGGDIPVLLKLLEDREERRELTIKERLTKGRDLEELPEALAEFFQHHPEIARLLLEELVARLTSGSLQSSDEIFAALRREPAELAELIFGAAAEDLGATDCSLPRLLAWHLLSAIEVDGSNCFALVVHRTRRYSGFFRHRITAVINDLVGRTSELHDTDSLPILQQIIDFIRGRPGYDELREKVLQRIALVTRHSRELKVFSEATQTRELIIFKVKKLI